MKRVLDEIVVELTHLCSAVVDVSVVALYAPHSVLAASPQLVAAQKHDQCKGSFRRKKMWLKVVIFPKASDPPSLLEFLRNFLNFFQNYLTKIEKE